MKKYWRKLQFNLWLLAATLFALSFGSSAFAEIRRIRVEHYLQPGGGNGRANCLVVQAPSGGKLIEAISGFNFQWGVVSELTVEVTKGIVPGGGDNQVEQYKLISVDAQTQVPAGTGFSVFLADPAQIRGGTLAGTRIFQYASKEVEAGLQARIDNQRQPTLQVLQATGNANAAAPDRQKIILFFRHPASASQPLVLESYVDATSQGLE